MMVFKRKQIVVLSLILMIVVAGYLQYSYKRSSSTSADKNSGKLGEAVYVDNKDVINAAQPEKKDPKTNKDTKAANDAEASKQANDFFAQAKLDREIAVSKDTDTLKSITEDANASKDAKSQAFDKMMKIVDISQREVKIETMVREKGFYDAVALFGEDGSIDLIVKAPSLTAAQIAQLTDIIVRHGKISVDKIHIKNMY